MIRALIPLLFLILGSVLISCSETSGPDLAYNHETGELIKIRPEPYFRPVTQPIESTPLDEFAIERRKRRNKEGDWSDAWGRSCR